MCDYEIKNDDVKARVAGHHTRAHRYIETNKQGKYRNRRAEAKSEQNIDRQ